MNCECNTLDDVGHCERGADGFNILCPVHDGDPREVLPITPKDLDLIGKYLKTDRHGYRRLGGVSVRRTSYLQAGPAHFVKARNEIASGFEYR